jgi:hypothetical protein
MTIQTNNFQKGEKMKVKLLFLKIVFSTIVVLHVIGCTNEVSDKNSNLRNTTPSNTTQKKSSPIDLIKIGKSYRFKVKDSNPRGYLHEEGKVMEIDKESGWIKLKYAGYSNKVSYPYFRFDDIINFTELEEDLSLPKNMNTK